MIGVWNCDREIINKNCLRFIKLKKCFRKFDSALFLSHSKSNSIAPAFLITDGQTDTTGAIISACRPSVNKSSALITIRSHNGADWIEKIDITPGAIENAREVERIPTRNLTEIER